MSSGIFDDAARSSYYVVLNEGLILE